MPLSCECDYDYDYYYNKPDDFTKLDTKRRRRCCSCFEQIDIGATCAEFDCYRTARTDIEERIHGDEVPMASKYMCEGCGEIFFNLTDLEYCITLGDDMRELLKDYWQLTGFKPKED